MALQPTKPSNTKKSSKSSSKSGSNSKPSKKVNKTTTTEVSPPMKVEEKNTVAETQPVSSIAPDAVTIESSLSENLTVLADSIQSMTTLLNKIKTDYKALEKQVLKEARSMDKVNAKRKKSRGARAPSGFVKPTAISKELAKFLNVPENTKMARTDVTKMITAYVKTNKLQAPNNGRKILPDKKLSSLLNCKSSDEVTYFNLQKYMKPHFVKSD